MDQTWKMTAILVLAFAIAVQSTECRLLQQTSGGKTIFSFADISDQLAITKVSRASCLL